MIELAAFIFLCWVGYKIVVGSANRSIQSNYGKSVSDKTLALARSGLLNNSAFMEGFKSASLENGQDFEEDRHLFLTNDGNARLRLALLMRMAGISEQDFYQALAEECKPRKIK